MKTCILACFLLVLVVAVVNSSPQGQSASGAFVSACGNTRCQTNADCKSNSCKCKRFAVRKRGRCVPNDPFDPVDIKDVTFTRGPYETTDKTNDPNFKAASGIG